MIKQELKSRTVYVVALISAFMLLLAYQVKAPFEIDLGERGDAAYLHNFYDVEDADGLSYRWSSPSSSIIFPGIGGYVPALLQLRLNGSRPAGLPLPTVGLSINGQELASFTATDEFETYEFGLDGQTVGLTGNLEIEIDSEVFVPAEVMEGGDQRELGVLVDWISVEFQGNVASAVLPAPLQTLHLLGTVVALYLLARWIASQRGSFLFAIAILATLSMCTAVGRPSLMRYSSWLFVIPALTVTVLEFARLGPRTTKGVALATVLALAGAWSLHRFSSIMAISASGTAPDLANNYTAAVLLRHGGFLYDLDELARISEAVIVPPLPWHHTSLFMSYDNPPLTAALIAPVTALPFRTAVVTFVVLSGFFLFCSLWLILRAGGEDLLRYPQWVLALILALNFGPIHHSLALGQLDLFILLLLALVYWGYKGHRDILAGCSLGLVTMLKFSPVLLILFFLLQRRYRIFVSAVALMAVIAVLSWAIAGTENWIFFITDILPVLLSGCANPENQSLSAFFSRLFVGEYYLTDYVRVPYVPQARLLTLFASLSLVAVSACLVRKRVLSRDDPRFDLQFALVVIALPLLSTLAWYHYMTWYILPFVILLNPRLRESLSLKSYCAIAVAASLVYLAFCIPVTAYAPIPSEGPGRLLLSQETYAALSLYALFACLLVLFGRRSRRPPHRDEYRKVLE